MTRPTKARSMTSHCTGSVSWNSSTITIDQRRLIRSRAGASSASSATASRDSRSSKPRMPSSRLRRSSSRSTSSAKRPAYAGGRLGRRVDRASAVVRGLPHHLVGELERLGAGQLAGCPSRRRTAGGRGRRRSRRPARRGSRPGSPRRRCRRRRRASAAPAGRTGGWWRWWPRRSRPARRAGRGGVGQLARRCRSTRCRSRSSSASARVVERLGRPRPAGRGPARAAPGWRPG